MKKKRKGPPRPPMLTPADELACELLESSVVAWQLAMLHGDVAVRFGEVFPNTPHGARRAFDALLAARALKEAKGRRYSVFIVPAAVPMSPVPAAAEGGVN